MALFLDLHWDVALIHICCLRAMEFRKIIFTSSPKNVLPFTERCWSMRCSFLQIYGYKSIATYGSSKSIPLLGWASIQGGFWSMFFVFFVSLSSTLCFDHLWGKWALKIENVKLLLCINFCCPCTVLQLKLNADCSKQSPLVIYKFFPRFWNKMKDFLELYYHNCQSQY